jgi:putative transposase
MIRLKDILSEELNEAGYPEDLSFEEFAQKRLEGATKISNDAKEKGGAALLTYHHFVVKLPYYKKAAEGNFNQADTQIELKKYLDALCSVSSDMESKEFINPRYDKYWNKKIDKVRSMRDKKKKNSKRYKGLSKSLNKLYDKRRKQQNHYHHTLSKYIVSNYKNILIGNINQQSMTKKSKSKKLNRSTQEGWGLRTFNKLLEYKAKLHDSSIVKVNEYMTSKTCSNCGNIKEMPLNKRVYECSCGMKEDRDINSSINIFNNHFQSKTMNYKLINQRTTLHFHFGKLDS